MLSDLWSQYGDKDGESIFFLIDTSNPTSQFVRYWSNHILIKSYIGQEKYTWLMQVLLPFLRHFIASKRNMNTFKCSIEHRLHCSRWKIFFEKFVSIQHGHSDWWINLYDLIFFWNIWELTFILICIFIIVYTCFCIDFVATQYFFSSSVYFFSNLCCFNELFAIIIISYNLIWSIDAHSYLLIFIIFKGKFNLSSWYSSESRNLMSNDTNMSQMRFE